MSTVVSNPPRRKTSRPIPLYRRPWRWPDSPTPELDETRFEPATPADRLFEVFSAAGRVLDRFADRWEAVGAMARWPQACFVAHGGQVIARKPAGEGGGR